MEHESKISQDGTRCLSGKFCFYFAVFPACFWTFPYDKPAYTGRSILIRSRFSSYSPPVERHLGRASFLRVSKRLGASAKNERKTGPPAFPFLFPRQPGRKIRLYRLSRVRVAAAPHHSPAAGWNHFAHFVYASCVKAVLGGLSVRER
ncbi:MAG: hypothetical protein KH284_12330 [Clostridiales bacterium]|nr:hypothetical protein [Clostridiales bacterium]